MKVLSIDHLVLNVRDVELSADWYRRVLGMSREDAAPAHDGARRTSLHFGAQKINLRPTGRSQTEWFTARTPQAGSDDLCFLVDATPEAVASHLAALAIDIELGPVTKRGAQGPIMSFYCRDPDGNLVELSSYVRCR
ncbi:MAG: VOC family protein [Azospirillaceae bacterium]|nr:VOC family protein [Azospirillaceae bacterium]